MNHWINNLLCPSSIFSAFFFTSLLFYKLNFLTYVIEFVRKCISEFVCLILVLESNSFVVVVQQECITNCTIVGWMSGTSVKLLSTPVDSLRKIYELSWSFFAWLTSAYLDFIQDLESTYINISSFYLHKMLVEHNRILSA